MKVQDMLHMRDDDVCVTVQCIFVGADAQCTLVRPSSNSFVEAGLGRAGQGMACFKRLMPGEGRSGALCANEAGRLLHRSFASSQLLS
jgi:hypothetical protein